MTDEQNPNVSDQRGLDPRHQPAFSAQVSATDQPGAVVPSNDPELKRRDLPTNDLPPNSFTVGAEDMFTTFRDPTPELGKRRVIAAPALEPAHTPMSRRFTSADLMDTPGMRAATDDAQLNPENVLLHAGDRVNSPIECYDVNDLSAVITMMPGAVVPKGMTLVPTNYVVEARRERELRGQPARRRR